jgi:type II secretory pathway pseudopilin PulG
MKMIPVPDRHSSIRGSALIYVLIAVALLAALTVSMMEPSSQQAQSQNATNLGAELESQIGFITAGISECVVGHPDQDSGLTSTEQKNAPYPINPQDPYFTTQSATPASDTDDNVEHIRCPGSPGGTGPNNQDHARIFGGASGKFLAPPPTLFDPWTYYNGADGVAIMIASDKTDAFIKTSLDRLDDKFSECEAEVIDRRGLGALAVTSDTTPGAGAARSCPAGEICFRYWVILKATAIHQDAGCP